MGDFSLDRPDNDFDDKSFSGDEMRDAPIISRWCLSTLCDRWRVWVHREEGIPFVWRYNLETVCIPANRDQPVGNEIARGSFSGTLSPSQASRSALTNRLPPCSSFLKRTDITFKSMGGLPRITKQLKQS
jgi:hypothetical protein